MYLNIKLSFGVLGRETRCINFQSDCAPCLVEDVGPGVEKVLVAVVSGGSAGTENCMVLCEGLSAVILAGRVPVPTVATVLVDAKSPVEH